jgi:hypothetical protein
MTDSARSSGLSPGGLMAPDQVVRLEQFRDAHPKVSIACDRRTREWTASWPGRAGIRKINGMQLKDILDTLENNPEVTALRRGR